MSRWPATKPSLPTLASPFSNAAQKSRAELRIASFVPFAVRCRPRLRRLLELRLRLLCWLAVSCCDHRARQDSEDPNDMPNKSLVFMIIPSQVRMS